MKCGLVKAHPLSLPWRDGYYPVTWSASLVASSILYVAAGLFWNLDWRPGRGVTFGFLEPGLAAVPIPQFVGYR